MIIDCETCPVAGEGCPDCVVAFFLDRPATPVRIDAVERRALLRLARAGVVAGLPPGAVAGAADDVSSRLPRSVREGA